MARMRVGNIKVMVGNGQVREGNGKDEGREW